MLPLTWSTSKAVGLLNVSFIPRGTNSVNVSFTRINHYSLPFSSATQIISDTESMAMAIGLASLLCK